MSDLNNFDNNQEQNSAPNVSKLSLDELNEIKKSIAPVYSKSEEEMLAQNPNIDLNTVYSEPKNYNSSEKIDNPDLFNEEINTNSNETIEVATIENDTKAQVNVAETSVNNQSNLDNDKGDFDLKEFIKSIENDFAKLKTDQENNLPKEQEKTENVSSDEKETSVEPNVNIQSVNEVENNSTKKSVFGNLFSKKNKIVDTSKIPSDNTSALQAEAEAPKTEKINLSELKAVKEAMKNEQNSGEQKRPSISEIVSSINKKDNPQESEADGEGVYDKNLDFERVTDIKKYKLPLPKLPFILAACFMFLIALGVGIGFIISNNKKNQVYIVDTVLNVREITGGFIGDTVNLDGVYITTTYSNGKQKVINDITSYITDTSSTIYEDTLIIKAANKSSWIMFNADGKRLTLTVKTLDNSISEIADIRLTVDKVALNSELKFDQILVQVTCSEYGTKILTLDEIKNNLKILYNDISLTKTNDGFLIGSLDSDVVNKHELTFRYTENGKSIEKQIIIDVV